MTEKRQNLEKWAGDPYVINAQHVDKITRLPIDITGKDIRYGVSHSDKDDVLLVAKTTTGGGVTIINGLNGDYRITIAPGDDEGLCGKHYHQARFFDGGGLPEGVGFEGAYRVNGTPVE